MVELKKNYKELVTRVKKHDKTRKPLLNEEVADALHYNRSYFSTLLGKRGNVTEKHIQDIKLRFPFLSGNTTYELSEPGAPAYGIDYKEKYIKSMEDRVKTSDEIIKSLIEGVKQDLQIIKANQLSKKNEQLIK